MNDGRAPLAVMLALMLGSQAAAQDATPRTGTDPGIERLVPGQPPEGAQPPLEEIPAEGVTVDARSLPERSAARSAEEEQAERNARIDALFEKLARSGDETREQDQADIRALWSQSGSDSSDLLLALASKAVAAKDYDEALRYLNDLVRLDPDFAEGWNARATVHFIKEDYGNAIADIQRTLTLEPRHFGAISGLGVIMERLGDNGAALQAYRRGLEIDPDLPGAKEAIDRLSPEVDGRAL